MPKISHPTEHSSVANTHASENFSDLNREKLIFGTGLVWISVQLFIILARGINVGFQYIEPITPFTILFTAGLLVFLRRKYFSLNLTASLLLLNIGMWLGFISYVSSGFYGPAVYVLIVIPVFSFLLIDSRAGWIAFVITASFLALVAYLNFTGFNFERPPVKGKGMYVARAVSATIVMFLVSWIGWFYTRLHREYQVKMEEKNRELEEISQYKSDFIASMSHELRTPLNSIIGFSQRLSTKYTDQIDDKGIMALEAINRNGHHLLTLVNDVLDAAKLDAGKLNLIRENYPIFKVLDLVVIDMKVLSDDKDLELVNDIDESLATIKVYLDSNRMRQIFSNLISNSIKYTLKGSITLAAELRQKENLIAISVTDTGSGIPEKEIENLFKHFNRLKEHERSNIVGTGLGLTIVSQLVEMHEGSIEVTSELGRGSCFTVCFPIAKEAS